LLVPGASSIASINGVEAWRFVSDAINMAAMNQDPDAAYNTMFYTPGLNAVGAGKGYFGSGGRIRCVH
jgi:hypothetical protein